MRGDPQVELRGAVLVGRRVAQEPREESGAGEIVTVTGLLLRIDSRGLTVEGPRPNVIHTVAWQRVRSVDAGKPAHFEDSEPARAIQLELDDRVVQFLVPADALSDDKMRLLNKILSMYASVHEAPAVPDAEPVPVAQTAPLTHTAPLTQTARALPDDTRVARQEPAKAPIHAPRRAIAPLVTKARPRRSFAPAGYHRHGPDPALPPPPPSSSVVMPPRPSDVETSSASSAVEGSGVTHNVSAAPAEISSDLLVPPAVPAARRVKFPIRPRADLSFHDPYRTDVSDTPRIPPLLPPPPPGGSGSRLPPPAPVESPPIEPAHAPQPVTAEPARAEPVLPQLAPAQQRAQMPETVESPPVRLPRMPDIQGAVPEAEPAASGKRGGGRKQSRRKRRSRGTTVLGGGLLLVAAAVGGSVFGLAVTDKGSSPAPSSKAPPGVATRSSQGGSPGGTLTGPSDSVDASTVSGAVNIIAAGLPPGWDAGHAPWSRVATAQSDTSLASCLGLTVAQLGIVTGTTEPGGPKVESSGWFTSQNGSAGVDSYVVVAPSVTTQQSDVAAIMANRTQSCLQGWFASLDQSGDQILGVPTVAAVPVAALSGERAAGFSATVVTQVRGAKVQVNEELVVLGAGRVEVGLVSESTAAQLTPSIESSELSGLEHRLKAVTTS